jgi:hypothetical protein
MDRPRRVYDLFDGPKGPSRESKWYDRRFKRVWQVVAVSVKQAIYLSAHDNWYDGRTGIVAYTGLRSDSPWRRYDGSEVWGTPWKHYQTFSDACEL